MNYLTVAAIVKNEADYIEEWLEFHLLQGVEHFYIYENGSTDRTIAKLLNYTGLITIIPWEDSPGQFTAYNHALKHFRDDSKWMAFLDVDEFLYSPLKETEMDSPYKSLEAITTTVALVLESFEDCAVVAAHWMLYGSDGLEVKTPGLVTERFLFRANGVNQHVKCVVQPRRVKSVGNDPHYFIVNKGEKAVDENRQVLTEPYGLSPGGTANLLRVNHYHLKSKAEYIERKKLGDCGTGVIDSEEKVLERFKHHDRNEVLDTTARAYLKLIKARLNLRDAGDA